MTLKNDRYKLIVFLKINDLIPDAIIDLKYQCSDNFTGRQVYDKPYDLLRQRTLEKLAKAANILRCQRYRLIIWDAYRPLKVQQILWDIVQDDTYVAHPSNGSRHNRGCAVDVTLADINGKELVMPSKFDDFTRDARADREDLEPEVKERLEKLQSAMEEAGFSMYINEWWHFNDTEWKKYKIV